MSRRVSFGASIVFITLCLQLFFSGATFAVSPDNAAAEKLCYRAIDKMELFLGRTPEPCYVLTRKQLGTKFSEVRQ